MTREEFLSLPPHAWTRRRDREKREDTRATYQCERCKRWSIPLTDRVDGGQCGVPQMFEHWKVGGVDGIVDAIDVWAMTFTLSHREGGLLSSPETGRSTHPIGTPDETETSP